MKRPPTITSFLLFAALLSSNLWWDKKAANMNEQINGLKKSHYEDSLINEANIQNHLRDSARLDRMLNIKIGLDKKYGDR